MLKDLIHKAYRDFKKINKVFNLENINITGNNYTVVDTKYSRKIFYEDDKVKFSLDIFNEARIEFKILDKENNNNYISKVSVSQDGGVNIRSLYNNKGYCILSSGKSGYAKHGEI